MYGLFPKHIHIWGDGHPLPECKIPGILFRKMCECKIDDEDVGLWGGGTLDR